MTLIITLLAISVINDLHNYRISNRITFTFAIIGIAYNVIFSSLHMYISILGLIIPLLALFPLYITKMLGAGDIKLFCAIGAFVGLRSILMNIAFSFLLGAVIAIAVMFFRKNAVHRFRYFYTYIKCCFLCVSILPYGDFEDQAHESRMHFSIPIALGTIFLMA